MTLFPEILTLYFRILSRDFIFLSRLPRILSRLSEILSRNLIFLSRFPRILSRYLSFLSRFPEILSRFLSFSPRFFASIFRNQKETYIIVLGLRIYPITAFLNKAYEAINGFIFVNIALHHLLSLI